MKLTQYIFILFFIATLSKSYSQGAYQTETPTQKTERMQWYTDARFGMFIHWGAYSVLDGEYKGKKQRGPLGEWIMQNLTIPIEDYKKDVVGNFNPTKFDADAWAKSAYDAGMKYMVMTTKHHDGFALFQSDVSDYNIVAQTPFGRDVIKELSEACKKYELKFGVYYSQAQDWYHAGGYTPKKRWDTKQEGNWDTYFETIVKGQVTELFSNYGEISLIWWDSARKIQNNDLANTIGRELVKLQPNIIVNPRLSTTSQMDFQTFEQVIPGVFEKDYNELCLTQNRSWSYKPSDTLWKEPAFLLKTLTHMTSIGGNFLFNVGPKSNGEFPKHAQEALEYIGEWMAVNNEAIYETEKSPFYKLPFGEATMKQIDDKSIIYLHIYDWPSNGRLEVKGLHNTSVSASILGQTSDLKTEKTESGLQISELPKEAPHNAVSVIKLEISEPLKIDIGYIQPSEDHTILLNPESALLTIKPQFDCIPEVAYDGDEPYFRNWQNCIPGRIDTGNQAHWKVNVTEKGNYKVVAKLSTRVEGNFAMMKVNKPVHTKLPNTGGLDIYQTLDLGTLSLKKGVNTITFSGQRKKAWDNVQLKTIKLIKIQ
jgi:alpha-L-fucosidase